MADTFDLIIIGSGPGGYVAAIRAAQLGLRVAVVEKDPAFGGTCLHRGCIPTKALLHTAGLMDEIGRSKDFGIDANTPSLNLEGARDYKNRVVNKNAKGIEFLFNKNKITGIQGFGKLIAPDRVEVAGEKGTETYRAERIMIATGSIPREIPTAPTDGVRVLNSDHLLELPSVPSSLVVLGAGAVGCEFASIFSSFGAKVTLVEMLPRILPLEDEEISQQLERSFRKRKIRSLTSTKLTSVESGASELKIEIESQAGDTGSIECELLLVAVGRAPVTDGIGLDSVGVNLNKGYVQVNEMMQTDVPSIYAIGDVVETPWLAHVASAEGILAVEHMAGRDVRPLNYDHVPSVTYCQPEVGSVGLTESAAKDRGFDVAVGKFPFTALAKATIAGKTDGFVKVVRETKYDELLGVHIIGPHATDLIAEACVALQIESTTEELFRTMHAHPTLSEALAEAAHAATGAAIHI